MEIVDSAAQGMARQITKGLAQAVEAAQRPVTHLEAQQAVKTLLYYIGEDPTRDGLKETPRRVVAALEEMTFFTHHDPAGELSTTFAETSDEMILLRGIAFTSLCEHHLLPFEGEVTVGYLPGHVVGISKLARLVSSASGRLQVQERLTTQIALAIEKRLEAKGVGVLVRARHQCMRCRGVKQSSSEMVTSAMLGRLRESPAARNEFLLLAGAL